MARTGRFLLDTNIVIALFAGEAAIQQHVAEASEVFVPSIVLGELYYGARKSRRVTENLAHIDEFVASSTLATRNRCYTKRPPPSTCTTSPVM
jgi:tRNA(fMet)-specific endonuclease VapC